MQNKQWQKRRNEKDVKNRKKVLKKNSLESKQQQIVHKKDKNKKEMEGKVRIFK